MGFKKMEELIIKSLFKGVEIAISNAKKHIDEEEG